MLTSLAEVSLLGICRVYLWFLVFCVFQKANREQFILGSVQIEKETDRLSNNILGKIENNFLFGKMDGT